MNNDIACDMNNYVNPRRQEIPSAAAQCQKAPQSAQMEEKDLGVDMSCSMEMLGAINKAKVGASNPSVINSCKSFLEDPQKVESYNEICDFFVSRGYNLEKAIGMTDEFFQALSNQKTYQ